jgi:CheY-like chemotaxis protein
MAAIQHSTVLVLDDNLGDIDLLATAWTEAEHDQAMGIHSCTSCDEAMDWLGGGIPQGFVVSGALVDLMLFDSAGRAAIDVLGEQQILKNVPIIAWTGINVGKLQTDRMKKALRVWKKPGDWTAYADFTLRLYNAIGRCSSGSSTRLPTA